jgi:hypothetical protein
MWSGKGFVPEKGAVRGDATAAAASGTVVVFKGRKQVRKPGSVTLRLALTPAGKLLLRHSS